ncbi:MAG: tail length tape measure protein [Bacteriovoracaceae bacterium]|nr:tail length tape measure protein [Bacteriovoracaceae bacterium]
MPRKQKPSPQKPNVDAWLEKLTPEQLEAVNRASKIFPDGSAYNIHTLEGMYGQESSSGRLNMGEKNSPGLAGHFQISPDVAAHYGLKVDKKIDERFDVNKAATCAAKYIMDLDKNFSRSTNVGYKKEIVKTIPVEDPIERTKFALTAYNAGAKTIAKAQRAAQKAGKDPTKWDDVKQYLEEAGIKNKKKLKEIREYPGKVLNYSKEFKKKSQANGLPFGWHWITKDGRHILIKD